MKRTLSLLLCLLLCMTLLPAPQASAASDNVAINSTNFPDETFREFVKSNYDTNSNTFLSASELAAVTQMKVTSQTITSLQGIEFFTSLTRLEVGSTFDPMEKLASLDLSKNTGLKELYLLDCRFPALDLSKNSALEKVNIAYCDLQSLDMSGHTALTFLNVRGCWELTSLDLTGCANLTYLGAYWLTYKGNFTSLNIGACPMIADAFLNGSSSTYTEGWVMQSDKKYYPDYLRFKGENGTLDVDAGVEVLTVGAPLTDWQRIDGKWYYYQDGAPITGWKKLSNKWYYFDAEGVMQTGWIKRSGKWYYMNGSGAMQTGWVKVSGKWYYMNASGVMQTGWVKVSDKWYYMNGSGVMQIGWVKVSGKWYYMNASGVMQTGWNTISGKTYYFKDNGAMAAKEWCSGYWLNADGTWTYPYKASWKKNATGWWFGDESGWYARNTTITIDGKSYTFNARGYLV